MYERRDSSGVAIPTTLAVGVSSTDPTVILTANTGWPSGGVSGDFFMRLESEVIRISSRTGNSCTVSGGVSGRGQDGTSAMDHNVGVTAEFVFTRTDLNEANFAVSKTVGAVTNIGDLLYADAPNSLARLAKGTTGLALVAGATTPGYATLTATGLAADSVTATQIAAGAVGVSELAAAVQAMLVPPGVMVAYGGTAEPTGWLFANAQTVSRTTYAALFAIYGTTYNTGGEAGTDFRMPDLRGRVLVGMDNLGGTTDAGRLSVTNTMGGSGGAQTVTLTSTEMPAHTHVQDVHTHIQNSHNHTQEQHAHRVSLFPIAIQTGSTSFDFQITAGNWAASGALPATDAQIAVNQAALATNQNATAVNQSTGSGGAHDNMPPYQLCNILVKT